MPRFQSYIICTSPRSGSTLLCRLLRDTGVAGCPDSHFHEPSIEKWLGYYELNASDLSDEQAKLAAVFEAAIAYGKGNSDVVGLRLQRHSFDYFIQNLTELTPTVQDATSLLNASFGSTLLIHLTRRDKLGQAISYVKAQQTGLWHRRADGSELERLSPAQEPVYNGDAISDQMAEFQANDKAWEDWFAAEGLSPLRLTYEDVSANPIDAVSKVLRALGLDQDAAQNLNPSVAKLADNINRDWAERFITEQSSKKL